MAEKFGAERKLKNNAVEFLEHWDGTDQVILEACRGDKDIAEKVKNLLLRKIILEGDLEGGKGYSIDRKEVGIAHLTVRGENAKQAVEFFRPLVEDFANVYVNWENKDEVKRYQEALEQAKSGDFRSYADLLKGLSSTTSISFPEPFIAVGDREMSYTTASRGCEVSIDLKNNNVRFEKLDKSQGVGPYSYMRGGGFFNGIVRELYRRVQEQEMKS